MMIFCDLNSLKPGIGTLFASIVWGNFKGTVPLECGASFLCLISVCHVGKNHLLVLLKPIFSLLKLCLVLFHSDWLFCLIENDEICCKHAQCRCQGGFVHYEETKSIETTLLLDCLNKWFEGTIQIFFLDSITLKVGLGRGYGGSLKFLFTCPLNKQMNRKYNFKVSH